MVERNREYLRQVVEFSGSFRLTLEQLVRYDLEL